jgi:glycosyltransferase involved in cell wall biosynthesis
MLRNPVVGTQSSVRTDAFLGNYLPRKCGIATFTSDLLGAVAARHPASRCFAVPVNDVEGCYQYPDVVRFEIKEQDLDSYRRAADYLNTSNVDVVSVQHEFGIYGGSAGSHLMTLLRELKAPVVTTLHTVLLKPNDDQRRVMQQLIAHSTRLVVMTEHGRNILREVYHVPPAKVDLIPHGIPDVPFVAPDSYKGRFGLAGRQVLLTFGLLSPNKGIEHVLHALPDVVAEFPGLIYIVLGATHPHELRERGEGYRLGLEAIVRKNKIEKNVIFHNRFVDLKELTAFIGAADLYITPYLDEAQITSGTLAYAFGAGKPVISTPYWHAAELLADQRGALVPFADPRAIAREVSGLLRDGKRRKAMSDRAYKLGRAMVWSNTAEIYMGSFQAARLQVVAAPRASVAANGFGRRPHESPELNLDHLSNTPTSLRRTMRKATAPTTTPARLFWRCCSASWKKLPSASGRLPQPTPRFWTTPSISRPGAFTISSVSTAIGSMSGDPKIVMAGRFGRWARLWAVRPIGVRRRRPNRSSSRPCRPRWTSLRRGLGHSA